MKIEKVEHIVDINTYLLSLRITAVVPIKDLIDDTGLLSREERGLFLLTEIESAYKEFITKKGEV